MNCKLILIDLKLLSNQFMEVECLLVFLETIDEREIQIVHFSPYLHEMPRLLLNFW